MGTANMTKFDMVKVLFDTGQEKDRIEPANQELRVKTYKILDEIEALVSG